MSAPLNARWWASLGVLAVMLGAPLGSHLGLAIGAHDASRLAQLLALALCGAALLVDAFLRPTSQFVALGRGAAIVLGAAGLLAVAAVAAAPVGVHAARELCLLLGLVAATACVASLDFRARLPALMGTVALGSTMYAVVAFGIAAWVLASGADLLPAEMFFGYDSYRFYNHVQTIALPLLAVAACMPTVERRLRVIAAVGLVLGIALLLLSAGRATSVALTAGCVCALLVFRARARGFVGSLALGVLAGAITYSLLTLALPWAVGTAATTAGAGALTDVTSDHARFYLWRLAVDYTTESPWLGIGPMHYAHRLNPKAAHPHNVYLQIAAEWGVPMLLLSMSLATSALWRLRRAVLSSRDPADRATGIGLFATCIAVAVDAAFSGNFVMPVSQMWIAFLLGATLSWYRGAVRADMAPLAAVHGGRALALLLASVLLASQLWLAWNVYPEARRLSAHLEQVRRDIAPNARTNPRLWSHGWF